MTSRIEMGLDTFGDVSVGPDGRPQSMDRVLREILDQATLADEIGIDHTESRSRVGIPSFHS